jgi:Ca2+-binding RTX toxin-like protein
VVNSNLTLTLSTNDGVDDVCGGSLDDTLIGNAVKNNFTGGPGNDTIIGKGGDDGYQFDADEPLGSDTITDSSGIWDFLDFSATTTQPVRIDLSIAGPQVVNSNLTLTLSTTDGVDDVCGGSLDDTLMGNAMSNILKGGPGDDILIGSAGDDNYEFDADGPQGSDTINDSGGYDFLDFYWTTSVPLIIDLSGGSQVVCPNVTLLLNGLEIEGAVGGSLNDILIGNALDNTFYGGPDNDTLVGLFGNDTLIGGAGDDDLTGGPDNDELDGGVGDNDHYWFDTDGPLGSDTIVDAGASTTACCSGRQRRCRSGWTCHAAGRRL